MLSHFLRLATPPAVIAVLAAALLSLDPSSPRLSTVTGWLPPDEFGRSVAGILSLAIVLSLGKGLAITAVVSALASILAYIAARAERQWPNIGLRIVCAVVESVPLVLWVVIIVVSVKGPRLWVTLVAFGVLVLPTVTQVFLGEFARLKTAPFVEAAYLLGLSEFRVLTRYLLPAAIPILLPLLVQVLGNAIAIDGAIGVLGLGSRSDTDLGVFLLRGKEQFLTRPGLLLSTLLAYGGIFLYLQWLARSIGVATSRRQQGE